MADLYGTSSANPEPEEISAFLNHFLHNSFLSSSKSTFPHSLSTLPVPDDYSGADGYRRCTGYPSRTESSCRVRERNLDSVIDRAAVSSGFHFADSGFQFGVHAMDNAAAGDLSCESESQEGPSDSVPRRPGSSSKRSRAAEVHNMSEKRRRSRINEKMKALQNLIPNSNKTDKASMLDEAIEYLKHLQLKVQMLSMRNGMSLYPTSRPGVVQPTEMTPPRMGLSFNSAVEESLPQNAFHLSNQLFGPMQPMLLPLSSTINTSTAPFGFEPSLIQANFRSCNTTSQAICEDYKPEVQLEADQTGNSA